MTKSAIHVRGPFIRVGIFTVIALLIMGLLAIQLSGSRFTSQNTYYAEFSDVSSLKDGDAVQIAGVDVGKVSGLSIKEGKPVVEFHTDTGIPLTGNVHATVRYKNLLGDRYLELTSRSGAGEGLTPGSTIPRSRTQPALDLDSLLGGFQPLFQGLDPAQVNQLSNDLISVLQGQGGTLQQLLSHVGSVTNTLADHDQVIGDVVSDLNTVLATVNANGERFSGTLIKLQKLISGLSSDRHDIGSSFDKVAGLADAFDSLIAEARPELKGTLKQFDRTLAVVDKDKTLLELNLRALPKFYYRANRTGSYGSFFNFYICSIRFKLTGPDGQLYTPWTGPNDGSERCEGLK